jgi:N-acetylgalactosamine-N,N'-diacetylbacillosaminyl-diphospho-undecaprenol 4-alpha-N-acetylgalactosaminyltransferase
VLSNKRIVFVINSLEGGGAEKVLCNWLVALESFFTDAQVEVHLLLLDNVEEINTPPLYAIKKTLSAQGSLFKSFFQLKKALNTIKPDVVFSFLTRSNYVSTLLAKQMGIPVYISERVHTSSHFTDTGKGKISKALVKWIYPKATKVLAVSEGVKKDLVRNYSIIDVKCDVVYNAYNVSALEQKASEPISQDVNTPFIVGVGRLVANKNFALMIQAYSDAKLDVPLFIFGAGPELARLQSLIDNLDLRKKIFLKGYINNPYPFIKRAQFFVSTSNAEGFPNGIAEAICLGTPVLSTNCESGPAEIIADNVNFKTDSATACQYGVLCAPNSVAACVSGFELIMEWRADKDVKAVLAERAACYSVVQLKVQLVELLTQALDKNRVTSV